MAYDHNISERLKLKKNRKQSVVHQGNLLSEADGIDQLYRSLPQPFINKKQLSSFDPPTSHFKNMR